MELQAFALALGVAAIIGFTGCASTAPRTKLADGAQFHHDKDLQNVWLANGFDFNGYDVLYIAPATADLPALHSVEESNLLLWAEGNVPAQFADAIRKKEIFKEVVTEKRKMQPDQKCLILQNTIIEYEKGGGGARFWAGEFGAGQPVIRVFGKMSDGTNTVFAFESYRSGDSAAARLDPGWTPEQVLQELDIRDLSIDLADFIAQTSRHLPRK